MPVVVIIPFFSISRYCQDGPVKSLIMDIILLLVRIKKILKKDAAPLDNGRHDGSRF